MNKLFLSLLLASITVTSIKPAEQTQHKAGWLPTACIAGAGLVGLGHYAYMSGKKEKTKRLRGHTFQNHTLRSESWKKAVCRLPEVPGAMRWDILSGITADLGFRAASAPLAWSIINLPLIVLNYNDPEIYKDYPCGAIGRFKDFTKETTILALPSICLYSISKLAKKRSDNFKYQYIKANPDAYESQCALSAIFFEEPTIQRILNSRGIHPKKEQALIDRARKENEEERQAGYRAAVVQRKAGIIDIIYNNYIPSEKGIAGIINTYQEDYNTVPELWRIGDPLPLE